MPTFSPFGEGRNPLGRGTRALFYASISSAWQCNFFVSKSCATEICRSGRMLERSAIVCLERSGSVCLSGGAFPPKGCSVRPRLEAEGAISKPHLGCAASLSPICLFPAQQIASKRLLHRIRLATVAPRALASSLRWRRQLRFLTKRPFRNSLRSSWNGLSQILRRLPLMMFCDSEITRQRHTDT